VADACPSCGAVDASGAEFCRNPQCGAFLGWDNAAAGTAATPALQQPGARALAPPDRSAPQLRVEIADRTATVDPGASCAVTVTVHNLGHQVEELAVSVAGLAKLHPDDAPIRRVYAATWRGVTTAPAAAETSDPHEPDARSSFDPAVAGRCTARAAPNPSRGSGQRCLVPQRRAGRYSVSRSTASAMARIPASLGCSASPPS
jgi:hypothetical protein